MEFHASLGSMLDYYFKHAEEEPDTNYFVGVNACQIYVNKIRRMYCGRQGFPSCQISVIAVLGTSRDRGCGVG